MYLTLIHRCRGNIYRFPPWTPSNLRRTSWVFICKIQHGKSFTLWSIFRNKESQSDHVGSRQSHKHSYGAGHPRELSKNQDKVIKNKKKTKKRVFKKLWKRGPTPLLHNLIHFLLFFAALGIALIYAHTFIRLINLFSSLTARRDSRSNPFSIFLDTLLILFTVCVFFCHWLRNKGNKCLFPKRNLSL